VLPFEIKDFDAITAKQWERLRGTALTIEARVDRSDSGITLAAGQRVRVVACPADQWKWTAGTGEEFVCGAVGGTPTFPRPRRARRAAAANADAMLEGQMSLMVGDGARLPLGIATGPGHLWIQPENSWGLLGGGAIHVKILPVEGD
jgi:hypothetical protein